MLLFKFEHSFEFSTNNLNKLPFLFFLKKVYCPNFWLMNLATSISFISRSENTCLVKLFPYFWDVSDLWCPRTSGSMLTPPGDTTRRHSLNMSLWVFRYDKQASWYNFWHFMTVIEMFLWCYWVPWDLHSTWTQLSLWKIKRKKKKKRTTVLKNWYSSPNSHKGMFSTILRNRLKFKHWL